MGGNDLHEAEDDNGVQKHKLTNYLRHRHRFLGTRLREPRQRTFKHGHRETIGENETWHEFCLGTVDERSL